MSFKFMPLYTGDYLRDTRHLTPEENGIYMSLLMHCWDQKGPVPLDERKQCGIVNARGGGEIESLRRVLSEFFTRAEDGWYNKRIGEEIARAEVISHQNSEAGQKSAKKRASVGKADKSNARSTPVQRALLHSHSHSHSQPQPQPQKTDAPAAVDVLSESQPIDHRVETRAQKSARATRFALSTLPVDWKDFCKTKRPDLDPAQLFDKFNDYWKALADAKARKVDWFATWRNFVRNERATPKWAQPHKTAAQLAAGALALIEATERKQHEQAQCH